MANIGLKMLYVAVKNETQLWVKRWQIKLKRLWTERLVNNDTGSKNSGSA